MSKTDIEQTNIDIQQMFGVEDVNGRPRDIDNKINDIVGGDWR